MTPKPINPGTGYVDPNGPKTVPLDPIGGPKPVPVPIDPKGGQTTTGGGTSQPPIVCITQPCPPTSGNHQPTSGGHNHAHKGHVAGPGYVYGGASGPLAEIESGASTPIAAEAYAQCRWLKRNYDLTANVEWLNRYKQCLSWHHSD